MNRLLTKAALALLFAVGLPAFALTTGTVTDLDSQTWNNGTWQVDLISPNGAPTINGSPQTTTSAHGQLSASGAFSFTLVFTNVLDQSGAFYRVKVCPNASSGCHVVDTPITSATPDISSIVSANLKGPRFQPGPTAFGYLDAEVLPNPAVGATYFNTGTVCSATGGTRQFSLAGWACGGGGSSSPVAITGALADFLTVNGSGTTVSDISGNGNNGTFAASAPTWANPGLKFSIGQGVQLPASLNTARTQIFAVYLNPLDFPVIGGATTTNGTFQTLLTSGTPNVDNVLYSLLENSNFQGAHGDFAPSTFSNNTQGTACTTLIAGFHVIVRTTGTNSSTDPDHYYIDGQECQTYVLKTASASFQAGVGNYFLGAPATGQFATTSGLTGTLYRATFVAAEYTSAQAATVSAQVRASVVSAGVALSQPPVSTGTPQLIAGVDSITFGFLLANPATQNWAANLVLTNQPAYTITNYGIVGSFLSTNSESPENREGRLCKSERGPSVEIIFGGTNDINASFSPARVFGALASFVRKEKAAGCVVGVGTMISRTANDPNKDIYDNLILTGWKQIGADFIVDFAANPSVGADGANSGTIGTIEACPGVNTFFALDCIHPTAAGQLLLAAAASNSLNYFFGAKLGSPTVVTTTTYQMLSGDGVITSAPTANAAYTMPDCTGPSGADYIISNPQSAFTLSVIGKANQPINGLATAIAIPSNSTVVLHDVANPKAASGCHWTM